MSKSRVWEVLLTGLLLISLAGCGGYAVGVVPSTPDPGQAYAEAYTSLMRDYRKQMVELTSRPLPPRPTRATRQAFRLRLSRQIEDVADATAAIGDRMDALKPPTTFAELHAKTRGFFQTSAVGTRRWAAAIRAGKREEAKRLSASLTRSDVAAWEQIVAAGEKVGADMSQARKFLDEMRAEAASK